MKTASQISIDFWRMNQVVAPGSECDAWGDWVSDLHHRLGCGPRDDVDVPQDMEDYWESVVDDTNPDYTQGQRTY